MPITGKLMLVVSSIAGYGGRFVAILALFTPTMGLFNILGRETRVLVVDGLIFLSLKINNLCIFGILHSFISTLEGRKNWLQL